MGMIMAGVIMTNVLDGATLAIPDEWGEIITAAGLAIILIRSGLELDLKVLQKSGLTTLKLTCIPGCVEAIVCGISSSLIFGMPLLLSLSLGFIIAAVSPAVVVVGMLKLQNLGYGVAKGIPSLVVAAASFDDAVAIAGFTIFIGLAIQAKESSIVSAFLHGPVSLLLGIGVGSIAGFFLSL
jgi:NhaP-type Na+/H+ or K+/H+ antiporter